MIKKIRSILLLILVIIQLIPGTVSANNENEIGIYSGITLFGPYGDGHSTFAENLQVMAGEIHTLGWGGIEKEEGVYDWSIIDNYLTYYELSGKKASVRIQSAGHSTQEMPRWLYEEYGVRQVTGQGVFFAFESGESTTQKSLRKLSSGTDEYITKSFGTVSNGVLTISGSNKTAIESTNNINKYDTQLGFDYRGNGTIKVIVDRNGSETTIDTVISDSEWKSKMMLIPKSSFDYNSKIKIVVVNGDIELDHVSVSAKADGFHNFDRNLCYPNFFDPIYVEKYTNFIKAFADRYRNNPHLGAVVVGGFGRWDELSMLGDTIEENNLLTKQWKAYGYYDNLFINHIENMSELFFNEFGETKELILHIAAFQLPATGLGDGAGDQNYVGYAVNNISKKYGFAAKTNGLTEKMTEWGQAQNGFSFFANRYKYENHAKHILETALQINNPMGYWSGHPLSMYNRVLIDQVDNLWHYSSDLQVPFIQKYFHYLNEQSGSSLFTRSYNILMTTPFRANQTNWDGSNDDKILRNLWNGFYLTNEISPAKDAGNNEHQKNYDYKGDRQVLTTKNGYSTIRFSLDDRQSYNVLYGSVFAVEYFDEGVDSFDIIFQNEKGTDLIGTVEKTGSNTFNRAYFYVGDYFDTRNNGDKPDVRYEIQINDKADGPEYISQIEMTSVPSIDWKEEIISNGKNISLNNIQLLDRQNPVEFEINDVEDLSSVDVYLGTNLLDYVRLEATVYAIAGNTETLITKKEFFMPAEEDKLRLPVAEATENIDKMRIEIKAVRGEGYVFLNAQDIAYSTNKYVESKGNVIEVNESITYISAINEFYGIRVGNSGSYDFELEKKIGNDWIKVADISSTSTDELLTFEPQIAGQYRLRKLSGNNTNISLAYLIRRGEAKEATRYNLGSVINSNFLSVSNSSSKFWDISDGFSNTWYEDGLWQGSIVSADAYIETSKSLNIVPNENQIFHVIIKNETASDMMKVYWKNQGDTGYTEEKVAYIPIVPNDTEYREYSWPIGKEASRYYFVGDSTLYDNSTFTYADSSKGNITSFKVVPASGMTIDGGKVTIATMDLRDNDTEEYTFNEELNLNNIINSESMVTVANPSSSPEAELEAEPEPEAELDIETEPKPEGEPEEQNNSWIYFGAGGAILVLGGVGILLKKNKSK